MNLRYIVVALLSLLIVSCARVSLEPESIYDLSGRDYLYAKKNWQFQGRISIVDQQNSMTASIKWQHDNQQEVIELSGPFGQGRTVITIKKSILIIDDGDNKAIRYVGEIDDLIATHLGVTMPVQSLKYWVLGVVDPEQIYYQQDKGFIQAGWQIKYQRMQVIAGELLPEKLTVKQGQTKLKLIVSDWEE